MNAPQQIARSETELVCQKFLRRHQCRPAWDAIIRQPLRQEHIIPNNTQAPRQARHIIQGVQPLSELEDELTDDFTMICTRNVQKNSFLIYILKSFKELEPMKFKFK